MAILSNPKPIRRLPLSREITPRGPVNRTPTKQNRLIIKARRDVLLKESFTAPALSVLENHSFHLIVHDVGALSDMLYKYHFQGYRHDNSLKLAPWASKVSYFAGYRRDNNTGTAVSTFRIRSPRCTDCMPVSDHFCISNSFQPPSGPIAKTQGCTRSTGQGSA